MPLGDKNEQPADATAPAAAPAPAPAAPAPAADQGVDIGNPQAVAAAVGNPDDLFLDDSTKPESNWFQFEKVGDTIQGVLSMEPFETETKFGPQMVYVIQKPDGTEFNVGLKVSSHKLNIQQLKSAAVGDIVAFRFEKEVDTGKVNPAKSIAVRIRRITSAKPA